MSQSRVGLQGKEPLHFMDFSAVFKLETYFNPASGKITDALKSVTQNNGRALDAQSTNIDSSIAGQPFEQAFVGVSSPTFGTFTFGRQNSTLADLIAKYDPQQTSYAFSLLGLSGTPAGGGDTQDRRLDDSIKYAAHFFDMVHLGLQYKSQNSSAENYATAGSGEAFSATEVALGAEYAGASVDGFYTKIKDAVSVGTLSADAADGTCRRWATRSTIRSSGTISDNASYGVMASYAFGPATVFGGFQHITYMNPSIKLAPGFDDIGGYTLAAVNNTAYAKDDKILNVYWAGARYAVTAQFTAAIAYYGEKQLPTRPEQMRAARTPSAARATATSTRCPCRSTITSPSASTPTRARCGRTCRMASPTAIINTTMIDPTIGAGSPSNRSRRESDQGSQGLRGPETLCLLGRRHRQPARPLASDAISVYIVGRSPVRERCAEEMPESGAGGTCSSSCSSW